LKGTVPRLFFKRFSINQFHLRSWQPCSSNLNLFSR
jgi:hypothetical protein